MSFQYLKDAYNASTPGEWEAGGSAPCGYGWVKAQEGITDTFGQRREILGGQYAGMEKDARFIALSHNLMPSLLEAVDALALLHKSVADGDVTSDDLEEAASVLEALGYE